MKHIDDTTLAERAHAPAKEENELPQQVSWRVVDAWNAIPPCSYNKPYCHVQCPYFYECHTPEDDYDEELI